MGADGIKTGYLSAEQYSLASTIKKKERRLIAVGSGFKSKNDRSRQSAKLLTWGLTKFDTFLIGKKGEIISEIDVWQGKQKKVKVTITEDIYKSIPKLKKNI